MKNIVLLGDSTLDNAAYVGDQPDVAGHLQSLLPGGWSAALSAVDGAVIGGVARQLEQVSDEAALLVVSVGGNDALRQIGVLGEAARSVGSALDRIAAVRQQFEQDYRAMLEKVLGLGLPAALCTIYEPRFPDPELRRVGATALAIFNDSITREAFARGLPLVDLRLICDDDRDFANPIEPSGRGGAKIAKALAALVAELDRTMRRSTVFV